MVSLRALDLRGLLLGVWTAQTLMKTAMTTISPVLISITAHQWICNRGNGQRSRRAEVSRVRQRASG